MELIAAMGLNNLQEIQAFHINRRINSSEIRNYAEIYPCITAGCLLVDKDIPDKWRKDWERSVANNW